MGQAHRPGEDGKIGGLLALLREHGEAVEADLARYYHRDYRDRWRRDAHGHPLLTLRQVMLYVEHLPLEARTVHLLWGGRTPWSRQEQLLDEVRRRLEQLGGVKRPKADPGRKLPATERQESPERQRTLAHARARARERRRRVEAGEIT